MTPENPAPPAPRPESSQTSFDRAQFRVLLRAYFMLNTRGHLAQPYGQQGKSMRLWGVAGIYSFFGLTMGIFILISADPAIAILLMHAMTMMMVTMIAILESNQVLFNPQEEDVLGHRPISQRTLLTAKIANMIGITMLVAVSLNFFPAWFLLAGKGARPWIPLVHLAMQPLLCAFCSASVVFIFGLIARTVGRERFQLLVTWTQIVMMITATIGYQLLFRVIGDINMAGVKAWITWLAPLPPVWFMGLELSLATRQVSAMSLGLGAAALLATVGLAWAATVRLAGLQGKISESLIERQPAARPLRASRPARAGRLNPLLRLILRDPIERAGFTLATAALRRERTIMQQIYPQMAFVLAYPLLMLMSGTGHGQHHDGTNSMAFLIFGAWMLGTLPLTALQVFRTSERPDAAQIFAIAPLERPGLLFHGVRKAVLVWLTLPVAALLILISTLFLHLSWRDVLIALPLLLTLPTLSLLPAAGSRHYIPFANMVQRGNKAERLGSTLLLMVLSGVLIGGAWLAREYGVLNWLILAEIPILLFIHIALLRHIARRAPLNLNYD